MAFLGTVSIGIRKIPVQVGDSVVLFKLDIGAQVTSISEETFGEVKEVNLKKPSKIVYSPARHILTVIGQFTAILSYNHRRATQRVYVDRDLQTNLLGLPAIISLQLLYQVNAVSKVSKEIGAHFPKVFSRLRYTAHTFQRCSADCEISRRTTPCD